jgi:hypothetical protein
MTTRLATVVAVLVLSALATACGGGMTQSPGTQSGARPSATSSTPFDSGRTERPNASSTVAGSAGTRCPVEQSVCDQAVAFQDTLNAGGDAAANAAQSVRVTCPGASLSTAFEPLCTSANTGVAVEGFVIGQKVMRFVDRTELAAMLSGQTDQPRGRLTYTVRAVGCPAGTQPGAADCSKYFGATYAAGLGYPESGMQSVLLIAFQRTETGAAPVEFLVQYYDPPNEVSAWCPAIQGGSCQFGFGDAPVETSLMAGEVSLVPWQPTNS